MATQSDAAQLTKRPLGRESKGRETLLAAASDLMIEANTFDVSLHQIARKAGVTAPLVKYHFGSKDGLLIALAQRDTARSLEQLEELLALDLDPESKLRIHITGIIRSYSRKPYLNGLLDSLLREDRSESARTMRSSFVRPLIEAQRAIIEEGIASGQFRPIDPTLAYFFIVGACQYVFSTRVGFGELTGNRQGQADFVRDYAAFAVETVLRGLRAA